MTEHVTNAGPEAVMQMFQAAQATALLAAGIDLGVFGAIEKGARTVDEIASAVRAPARSTLVILDGCSVLGLLVKHGERYENAPIAATHLVPGKPMYMGDIAGIFASPMMWESYGRLAEAVRNDGTVLREHAETPKHPFWEAFARSSAAMAFPAARALATALGPWMDGKSQIRMLDVACGSGIYGLSLAENPKVDLTLLDWPNVLVETRKWAERLGADLTRIRWMEGNLFEVEYGGPYDLVLLSHVFHHFDDATCAALAKRIAASVVRGGRVAINDFLYDAALANPMGALFRTVMLAWTRKGSTYTEQDYRRWLEGAGLAVVDVRAGGGMPTSLVIAEKR